MSKSYRSTVNESIGVLPESTTKSRSFWADALLRLVKTKPLGTLGALITLILLFAGIFAPLIAPYGMNESIIADRLTPPSAKHLLGVDNVGRDILSRVIYGARISVIVGLSVSILATIVSLLIGTVSGYVGGKLDLIMQRAVDIVMSFPALLLMMIFMAIAGPGMFQVIIVVGLLWGFIGSRIIRSAVIGVKENAYVTAGRSIGCSTTRILVRHILPNIMAPAIILFTTRVPNAILVEASLSFLGFGIPPPTPSWGGMLSGTGRLYMFDAPWMAIWPGVALAVVVYGINMFGDALRDILDPRLRGGIGRYGKSKQALRQKMKEKAGGNDRED